MSEAGRGASANSAGIGGFWGAGGAQKGNRRGYSPEHYQARRGAFFARFAGSGFAAARVRPARAAESGVGAGREFPECTGKGAPRPAPHSATGKAFFRPSVGIRRIRANARARWPRPRVSGGVRRPCAGVIFSAISYYRKIAGRDAPSASARSAPRSPESAQGANSPNAPARGGGKQSRPAQQGKRFSARPSAVGGFGGMRRAGRVRGRRRSAAGSGRGMTSPRFAVRAQA